jgi:predicted transcriptional regulator of viral defense system
VKEKIIRKKTLSTKEIDLISRLEFYGKEIYAKKEIISFCRDSKLAAYLIKKLLEKGRLRKIIKNLYLFVPMKAPGGLWAGNEYLIAKALARRANYYIGYATVFNSYGFTDQVAQLIQIVNDKYSVQKTFLGVRYKLIKVLPNRFYGLETRKIKNEEVVFPTKERAMIDVFEFYGIRKAYAILKDQFAKLNKTLFVEYLSKYPVLRVRRRVGFFLETLGVDKKFLSRIDVGEKGYTPLYDTGSNKGEINKIWRVIING